MQGENPWAFPETVKDHEKSEDLELGRALLKLDIHIKNVVGPDGTLPFVFRLFETTMRYFRIGRISAV